MKRADGGKSNVEVDLSMVAEVQFYSYIEFAKPLVASILFSILCYVLGLGPRFPLCHLCGNMLVGLVFWPSNPRGSILYIIQANS